MRTRLSNILMTVCAITTFSVPALAQVPGMPRLQLSLEDRAMPSSLLRDSWAIYNTAPDRQLSTYFASPNSGNGSYLTSRPDLLYGIERIELSPAETALRGLELGASAGLFAGALAGTFGLWEEDTTWALIGALGAIGAILGGTVGADDDSFRVRYRWRDE